MRGNEGIGRIGNRRNSCPVCNRWAQRVLRETRSRLMAMYPEEYGTLRLKVEIELYPQVMEEFLTKYPQARPKDPT